MTIRMSGLSGSGLDVDAIVKESMKPYKLKVDTAKQQRDVVKYQQEQYRKIISDSRAFYSKYLDVAKTDSLMKSSNYGVVSFTTSDTTGAVSAKGLPGASVDSYTVKVTSLAAAASTTVADNAAGNTSVSNTITMGSSGASVTFNADQTNGNNTVANYNTAVTNEKNRLTGLINDPATTAANKTLYTQQLNDLSKVTAKYSTFSKGVVFSATSMGQAGYQADGTPNASFTLNGVGIKDTQANATITNGAGQSVNYTGNSNTTIIDGVQFNFNAKTTTDVTLVGKVDATDLKKKIVSFVNDYNTLLGSINTKLFEKRDKSFMPLTDDQKSAMTDDQIAKWETKAQTGLLRKDSYLESLTSSMKEAMRTMSDAGIDLEEIGIKPVKDYTDKNGLFTIDEDKLDQALEANPEKIKDLFLKDNTTSTSKDGGILVKLQDAFQSSTQSTTSAIVQKAGVDGSVTDLTSLISKDITKRQKAIDEMESGLIDRENGLYKKYSALETALSKLNSQQSSLSSYFSSGN